LIDNAHFEKGSLESLLSSEGTGWCV